MATREQIINMLVDANHDVPIMELMSEQPLSRLRYSIAEASSYSGIYEP